MEKERPVGKSSSLFNLVAPANLDELNAGFTDVGEYLASEENTTIMQSTFEPIDMNPSDEATKEEVEWLKTQDRMVPIPSDIYKFDKKMFILKEHIHPSSRLCSKPNNFVTSVSQCNAPEPFDEKELPNMGPFHSDDTHKQPPKLSRNEIIEKGEVEFRNAKHDYEAHRVKKEVQCNWSTALLADKMRKLDPDDQRVSCIRVQIDSTSTDPLGRYSVYVPASGLTREEANFKKTVVQQAKYPILTDIVTLRGLGCNYYCRIQNGLNTFIDNIAHQEKNRVLLIDSREREELCHYCMQSDHSLSESKGLQIRQLSPTEYNFLLKNCRDLQMRNPDPATTNAYELTFGNVDEIPISMLSANNWMMYPTPMETKFNLCEREIIGIKLSWQPYPAMCQGEIIVSFSRNPVYQHYQLNSPKDVGFCQWVFTHNSISCTTTVRRLNPDNRTVEISLDRGEVDSYDDKAVEYMLKRIMKANNIEYEKITLFRHADYSKSYHVLKTLIHQRIGRAAVNCGIWESVPNESTPGYDDEWFRYIEKYEHTLPWRVYFDPFDSPLEADRKAHGHRKFCLHKGDPRLAKERSAVVIFEQQHYAKNIIDYIPEKPNWEFMSFSRNDTRGVSFQPFFTIRRQVPSFVRAVIDDFIRQEDTIMRQNSNLQNHNWCQYADDSISEHVLVEGWPISRVKETAKKLDEQLNGIIMDCSEPKGNGRLLHGVGLAYLNKIQKQQKGKVVIALYQLEKRIHIIGNMQKECRETKELLCNFITNRNRFLVRTSISIEQPRFVRYIGERIAEMVYKPKYELRSSIDFSTLVVNKNGSELGLQCNVDQYEDFRELLDNIQTHTLDFHKDKILVAMECEFENLSCPLCMSPVLYACYRLTLCGHLYCLDCFRQMISFHLKNRELPIHCQYEDKGFKCMDTIALNDVMRIFFDDNFIHYPNFFKDRLELLVAATTDFAVKKNQGMLRYCTVPDCPGIIFKNSSSTKFHQSKCGVCGFKICSKCFYPPHPGVTCEVETANQESVDASIKYYMSKKKDNVKHCPTSNCQGVIEKDAGCNHVQCSFCKNHFCWLCNFQSSDQSMIYKHMGSVHGGFGGGWEHLDRGEDFHTVDGQGPVGIDGFPEWIIINGNRIDMATL